MPGSLAELIDFNRRNAAMVLSRFGQEIFEQLQATSGDLADPEYLDVRGTSTRLAVTALEAPMRAHKLDAIAWLTGTPAWLTDYVLGDHEVFGTPGRPPSPAGHQSPSRLARYAGCRSGSRSPARAGAAADRARLRLRAGHRRAACRLAPKRHGGAARA